MTDLRVWLESQAFELHQMAVDFGPHSGLTVIYEALAILIDGMLEEHPRMARKDKCAADNRLIPCPSLVALTTYVSAVTGNTPPEGAP